MIVCIQCSMKAMLEDKPTPSFDETTEEHIRKHHPDQNATNREREELNKRLAEKFGIAKRLPK